jgi:hypothetical protein
MLAAELLYTRANTIAMASWYVVSLVIHKTSLKRCLLPVSTNIGGIAPVFKR